MPEPTKTSLKESVGKTTTGLQTRLLAGDPSARRVLAELRRRAGSTVAADPLGFQLVIETLDPPLDPSFFGKGDEPSPSETAAFGAMGLFALHMQSARQGVHDYDTEKKTGTSFGGAIGKLVARSSSGSLKPRFDSMVLARTERERMVHLRSLVTLLRGSSIGLDYGQLAEDLRSLAGDRRQSVLLRWSRDYARAVTAKQETTDTTSAASTD